MAITENVTEAVVNSPTLARLMRLRKGLSDEKLIEVLELIHSTDFDKKHVPKTMHFFKKAERYALPRLKQRTWTLPEAAHAEKKSKAASPAQPPPVVRNRAHDAGALLSVFCNRSTIAFSPALTRSQSSPPATSAMAASGLRTASSLARTRCRKRWPI